MKKNISKFFDTDVLESGAYDAEKGELTLTVIKPGFNASKQRFYPDAMLRRDYRVFEGCKMFSDHQTEAEEKARPEGSINSWAGQIKKVWSEADGRIRATCAVIDESLRKKLQNLAAHGLLGEMGISIRAAGEARVAEVQGVKTNIIERLVRGRSVDFVTYPGAGGRVEAMESNQSMEDDEMDEDTKKLMQQVADLTSKLSEANAKLKEAETALAEQKKRLEESERAANKAEAKVAIDGMLSEAKLLPETARKRLAKRFEGAEASTGVKEAIEEEIAYLKEIGLKLEEAEGEEEPKGKAKVKNMGANESAGKETAESIAAAFKTLGLSEAASKRAAGSN